MLADTPLGTRQCRGREIKALVTGGVRNPGRVRGKILKFFRISAAPAVGTEWGRAPVMPATIRVDQSTRTRFSADDLPLRPGTSSNSTFWPSSSELRPALSTAEICTNASREPSLGWMNPYPLLGLNHFTVPVAMGSPFALLIERAAIRLLRLALPLANPPRGGIASHFDRRSTLGRHRRGRKISHRRSVFRSIAEAIVQIGPCRAESSLSN